jgi:translation elongation factor EF-Tu-like GTPase
MTLLFRVEDVFDISGRGCVIAPVIPADADYRIRAKDQIQLRAPDGRVLDTHIASIELLKPRDGSACRMAIMLPRNLVKQDVPPGTEVWLLER